MPDTIPTLSSRREFLFCYDIKMGNPNGDPDENRPRVLPDKTHYVTDVRLKRFVRDYLKSQGQEILVDTIEGKTTNLTGRVAAFLAHKKHQKVESAEKIVEILLEAFIDARLFGSTFAFAAKEKKQKDSETPADVEKESTEQSKPKKDKKKGGKPVVATVEVEGQQRQVQWVQPATLTGPVQIQIGEVKHRAQEVDIAGTSIFGSLEEKERGTFTTYYALRYALIAFNGVANQHSAKRSRLTDADYDTMLRALWYGVRSAGNTRTKRGQVPRLLVSVVYKPGEEFQFGNLMDYLHLKDRTNNAKQPHEWASPDDYTFDLTRLVDRLKPQGPRIQRIEYCASPDAETVPSLSGFKIDGVEVKNLDLDQPEPKAG
jgi:CRISPR-associated protein Csh2